jgi:hypothetical protein
MNLTTLLINNNAFQGPIPLSFLMLNLTRCNLGQRLCSFYGDNPINCGQFPLCYPPLTSQPVLPPLPTETRIIQARYPSSSSAMSDITMIILLLAIVFSVLLISTIVMLIVKYSKKPNSRNHISPQNEEVIKALITPITSHEDNRLSNWKASERSYSSDGYIILILDMWVICVISHSFFIRIK